MENKSPAAQSHIRELNLSSILWQIHRDDSLSRARMAIETGLNKSTVSSLVDELIQLGLVRETGQNSIGTGRPATLLEINPQAGCIIGVDMDVDFTVVALTDFLGNILWRSTVSTEPAKSQENILRQTLDLVVEAMAVCEDKHMPLLGLGLVTPGTVDINEGVLVFAPNLHWLNVPLRQRFAEYTGLNVLVENDANAAAVAEHLFGAARQCSDFVFVFAGVGIGGGFFLNGDLYRGKNGFAGEIGHSPIMAGPLAMPCHCGNHGCWETHANQYSIIQRVQASLAVKRDSIIPNLMAEQRALLSIPLIKQAADAGDIEAIHSFTEAGTALGLGLATIINFLNPEKIIFGGPLSIAAQYMLPSAQEAITKHCLTEINKRVNVELSQFGEDASLFGAIAIVVNNVLSYPTKMKVVKGGYIRKSVKANH